MQETWLRLLLEHESSQASGDFDSHAYKLDRRITSGADIIVRDVMSFAENEPVDEVIDQFKNYRYISWYRMT
jgi:hypothetical protein